MRKIGLLLLLTGLAGLSGCAGGRSYDYSIMLIEPKVEVGDVAEIALGVHDQRSYVVNGEKYPQYVGTQRSPAYVPWNINTRSGKPMAEDFLQAIRRGLAADGYTVRGVVLSEKEDKKQALAKLMQTGADRILLFTIREWFFDVWTSTRISTDVKLEVYDGSGRMLAGAETKKEEWDGNKKIVPDLEFKAAVEKLISDDAIVQALQGGVVAQQITTHPARPTETRPAQEAASSSVLPDADQTEETCTTEQILRMKAMGMSDRQVKAACR